jgi:hypothetical protein
MRLPTMLTGISGGVTATAAVALVVASGIAVAYLIGSVASGQTGSSGHYYGAPGPLAGAGLPGILVVGCGAYWLVRRQRRKSDTGRDLKN